MGQSKDLSVTKISWLPLTVILRIPYRLRRAADGDMPGDRNLLQSVILRSAPACAGTGSVGRRISVMQSEDSSPPAAAQSDSVSF
jgi:hypothetical protein